MRLPSTSPITMPFGSTEPPYNTANPHKGTDFAFTPDNRVYAPFSGRVICKPLNGNDGNAIYMTDDQGRLHGLLHMLTFLVPSGAAVTEGQVIGIMGDTGEAEGAHLHWAVKQGGEFIDPVTILPKVLGEEVHMQDIRPIVHATPKQIDDTINYIRLLAGTPDSQLDALLVDLRPLLTNNYVEGTLQALQNFYTNRSTNDPDGQKWRDYKALQKELNG